MSNKLQCGSVVIIFALTLPHGRAQPTDSYNINRTELCRGCRRSQARLIHQLCVVGFIRLSIPAFRLNKFGYPKQHSHENSRIFMGMLLKINTVNCAVVAAYGH